MALLSYPDLYRDHDFSLASVVTVKNGKARYVQTTHQRLQVTDQAEHIGFLNVGDKVIALCLPRHVIIVARLMEVDERPAYMLKQYDENTIGYRFAEGEFYTSKRGDFSFKNARAELSMSHLGEISITPTRFKLISSGDIVIKTFTGNIHCYYPEF